MNNIKTDTTMNKGGDGNKGFDTLKVFEAFAGYGSQSIALRNLGVPYEVVAISEIDKYAIKAYEAIHGSTLNLGDITKIKVEDIPEHDLFTYSFPCQDLSVAGKQAGLSKGTRSGLLYECEKIIEHCKPKYLLLENVKNLVGKKFKPQFDEWLDYLESLGYTNYWKVLNAKDYGVPQNRERVFVISILGDHKPYKFADKIPLDKCIADILEDEVESKYYMNKPFHLVNKGHQAELDMKGHDIIKRVYATDRIAPTLTTMGGGNTEPKILIPQVTKGDYIVEKPEIIVDDNIPPYVRKNFEREKYDIANSSKAIYQCECESGWQDNKVGIKYTPTLRASNSNTFIYHNFRIRKLTPRECFRLMGMKDSDIDKIQQAGISNTQQYKMAGNSIVVDVLEAIFKELFLD